MSDDDDAGRTPQRLEALEIRLAELEYGQGQIDDVVRRQGEDIRRLTAAVRQLGTRLEAALGEPGAARGGAGLQDGPDGGPDDDPEPSPTVDPERPPHYSGPV